MVLIPFGSALATTMNIMRLLSPFYNKTLRINILITLSLLIIALAVFLVANAYLRNSRNVLNISDNLIWQVTETVMEQAINYMDPASSVVTLSGTLIEQGALDVEQTDIVRSYADSIFDLYPQLSHFYYGDTQGQFWMRARHENDGMRERRVRVDGDAVSDQWRYFNADGELVREEAGDGVYDPRKRPWYYDSRQRPWYKGRRLGEQVHWTDVYVFATPVDTPTPGITAARKVVDANGVHVGTVGADIPLAGLSRFLKSIPVGAVGITLIVNEKDELIAFPEGVKWQRDQESTRKLVSVGQLIDPYIRKAFTDHHQHGFNKFIFEDDGARYVASFTDFPEGFSKDWRVVVIVPESKIIGPLREINLSGFALLVFMLIVCAVIIFVIAIAALKETEQ